jgi:hypothetical protein
MKDDLLDFLKYRQQTIKKIVLGIIIGGIVVWGNFCQGVEYVIAQATTLWMWANLSWIEVVKVLILIAGLYIIYRSWRAEAGPQELVILRAEYGAQGHHADVTHALRRLVKKNSLYTYVGNQLNAGVDPCQNILKEIYVRYKYKDIETQAMAKERDALILPEQHVVDLLQQRYEQRQELLVKIKQQEQVIRDLQLKTEALKAEPRLTAEKSS